MTNTVYNNNQDPYLDAYKPGEIHVTKSGNTRIWNNIVHSDGALDSSDGTIGNRAHYSLSVQDSDGPGSIQVDYNMAYNWRKDTRLELFTRNNTVAVGANDAGRFGDPVFVYASTSPSTSDFRVKTGTEASLFNGPSYT